MPNDPSKFKKSNNRRWLLMLLLIVVVCICGYLIADWYQTEPETATRTFVGRESCVTCHQQEADLFHGSHHDLAMDLATKDSVMATFEGQEIEHFGITSRVFMDGERFMVNTEGPCLLYTSPSPRDATLSRMPSSA